MKSEQYLTFSQNFKILLGANPCYAYVRTVAVLLLTTLLFYRLTRCSLNIYINILSLTFEIKSKRSLLSVLQVAYQTLIDELVRVFAPSEVQMGIRLHSLMRHNRIIRHVVSIQIVELCDEF